LDEAVVIPGEPMALRMKVLGDGSGNWLRGRVTDAAGKQFAVDFSLEVNFTNWQTVTAMLPPEAVGPLMLDRIYMAALADESETEYSIHFKNLEALYPPPEIVTAPQGQRYTDPMRADLSDITKLNSDARVYDAPLSVEGYEAQKTDDITVIKLTAKDGGLYAADAGQWAKFPKDMMNLQTQFALILLDVSPKNFNRPQEAELLHKVLAEQRVFGQRVFVVSPMAEASKDAEAGDVPKAVCTIRDGVRYIELAKPGDGSAAKIRLCVEGKEIRYDPGA
jgi:hypothetical protein